MIWWGGVQIFWIVEKQVFFTGDDFFFGQLLQIFIRSIFE